jgi:hypothetical protein
MRARLPDGKVYKIEHKPEAQERAGKNRLGERRTRLRTKTPIKMRPSRLDPAWSSTVYFAPGTKYIWDLALDKAGNLYVATGDHGEIYKVTAKGEHSLFFKSDETHIRTLALDAQENVIAGSDGSGLVYRISPAGEGFVLYSAPKKEITALALDRAGNIYAAAVGEKRAGAGGSASAGAAALMAMAANATPGRRTTGSRYHSHACAGRYCNDRAICISRWRCEWRIGCLQDRPRRFAHADLDFA